MKKTFILLGMVISMLFSIGYAQQLNGRMPEGLVKNENTSNFVRPAIPFEGSAEGKEVYGVFLYPNPIPEYVAWEVNDFHGYRTITTNAPSLYGGGFYNDVLYAYEYNDVTAIVTFCKIKYETGELIQAIVRPELQGKIVSAVCYDYSEDQMYAIENNGIYIVNMQTGELEYVATINVGTNQLALNMAIDLNGIMYIIATDGNLYTVNKTNGVRTLIGNTGYYVAYAQSMAFDYETGKLYWNQWYNAGNFVEVDVNTASTTLLESMTFETTSFFIPYSHYAQEVPSEASNFTITPGASGALNAVLNWTNPATTFGGGTLTELTAVKIYENDILIHTVTNPMIGSAGSHTITVPVSATYRYKIVPENSAGTGPSARSSKYIGIDVPGAATNVVLSRNESNGVITWTAPTIGLHGGWFDVPSLTYNITRLPDNVVMATGVSGTTYTDASITQRGFYSYRITCVNNAGTGGDATSNSVLLGEAFSIPYTMGFENNEEWNLWRVVNGSNQAGWGRNASASWARTGNGSMLWLYKYITADDWIFSPPLKFEAGKNYSFRFWARCANNNFPQKLDVYIATGQSPEMVIGEALLVNDDLNDEHYVQYEVFLFDYEPGEYSIGIRCFSPFTGAGNIAVDDFLISELPNNDIEATILYGALTPMVGKQFNYKAVITNRGDNAVSGYTVKLMDANNNVLALNSTGAVIPRGEKLFVGLLWTPTTEGELYVRAVVDFSGDELPGNNESPTIKVTIQPEANEFTGTVGSGNILSMFHPFAFIRITSTIQTVYFDHDLIGEEGVIFGLNYFNNFYSNLSGGMPIKIWMANTNLTQLDTWLPESEFTLVYDGITSFPNGINKITIELDIPFEYEGQNLVIMTHRPWDVMQRDFRDLFYNTETPEFPGRTRYFYHSAYPFDWTQPGSLTSLHANIEFKMAFKTGSVSGVVTNDLTSDPIEGALVQIAGKNQKRFTNEDGEYNFDFLLPGEYTFNASKYGYYDKLTGEATVALEQNTEVDIELTPIQRKTVFGKVTGNDRPNGIDGVLINLTGYDNYSAISDENGDYVIENVYDGFTYTLTAKRMGYITHATQIAVNGDTEFDFMMNEILYAPSKITTGVVNNEYVNIEWEAPTGIDATYQLDDGGAETAWRFLDGLEGSFGNIYEVGESGSIIGFQIWAWVGPGSENNLVTVDVYNENRELAGSSQPFAFTPNGWVTVALDDYIDYNGTFYAMVHWHETTGDTHFLGYDMNGPNSQRRLSYRIENGIWANYSDVSPQNIYRGVFMIRVNALAQRKSVTYGYDDENSNKTFIDYKLFRFAKGQPEANWTTILESTTALEYQDYGWSTELTPGEYQYAVKARYTNGALSNARVSKVLVKDMHVDYNITITTPSGAPVAGANVLLKNKNGDKNYVYHGTSDANGKITLSVWRGMYDLTIKLRTYEWYEDLNVDITESRNKDVVLYEVIFPAGNVVAEYFANNNNVVVTWEEPDWNDEITYILDDGSAEFGWSMGPWEEAWLGNQFDVEETGELTSIDIYSLYNQDNGDKKITLDIFDSNQELIATSKEFVLKRDSWTNVPLDNIPYSGTFFVMIHWPTTPDHTNFVGYDLDGPNSDKGFDWYYHPYDGWYNLFELTEDVPGVFMIRANGISYSQQSSGKSVSYGYNDTQKPIISTISNETKFSTTVVHNGVTANIVVSNEVPSVVKSGTASIAPECIPPQTSLTRSVPGYNVYRLIAGQGEAEWIELSEHVAETEYTDTEWFSLTEDLYQYAVKANYSNVLSTAKLSNTLEKVVTYTVTYNTPPNGTLSVMAATTPVPSGTWVEIGTILTITATPNNNYHLETLTVNGTDFTNGGTHTVTSGTTIAATFAINPPETYTVIYETPQNGTLSVMAGTTPITSGSMVDEGTVLTITATPNDGYHLATLTVNGTDFTNGGTHTVTSATTIVVMFVINQYAVLYETPTNGILSVMNGATPVTSGTQVDHGTALTITATPNTGYYLETLTVNEVAFTSGGTHTVTSATTIAATFAINPPETYTVTFTVKEEGTDIDISGASIVFNGELLSGYVAFNVLQGEYPYTVSHDDYHTKSGTVTVVDQDVAHEVKLLPLGIGENVLSRIVLYPNPFTNEIYISHPELVKNIQITDVLGQVVKNVTFNGKSVITENLSSGIYLVTLESFIGEKLIQKVVKK